MTIKIHKLPDEVAPAYDFGTPIRIGPNVGVVLFRAWSWVLIRWDYWAW